MDIGFNGKITGGTRPATFSQPKIANVSSFLDQRKRLVAEHWNTVAKIGEMIASSGQTAGNIMSTLDAKREQRAENDYRTDFSTMKMKYVNGLNQVNDQLAAQDYEDPEEYRAAWTQKSNELWTSLRDDAEKNGTFRRWKKWGDSDRLRNDMELVSLAAEEQAANSWSAGWKRRQRQAVESNAQDAISLGITDFEEFKKIYQRDATMTPSEQEQAATQATKKSTINAATNMISQVAASTYTQDFWDNQNKLLRNGQYRQVEENQKEADKRIDDAVAAAKAMVDKSFAPLLSGSEAEGEVGQRRLQVTENQRGAIGEGVESLAHSAKDAAGKQMAAAKDAESKRLVAIFNAELDKLGKKSKQAAAATDREMKTKNNLDTAKELANWVKTGEAPTSELGLAVFDLVPDGTEGKEYVFTQSEPDEKTGVVKQTRTLLENFTLSDEEKKGLSEQQQGELARNYAFVAMMDDILGYSDATPDGIQRMVALFKEAKPVLTPTQYKKAWNEWMSQMGVAQGMKVNTLWRDTMIEKLKKDVLSEAGQGDDWKKYAPRNDDVADSYTVFAGQIKRAKTQEAAEALFSTARLSLLDLARTKKEQRDTQKFIDRVLGFDGEELFRRQDDKTEFVSQEWTKRQKGEARARAEAELIAERTTIRNYLHSAEMVKTLMRNANDKMPGAQADIVVKFYKTDEGRAWFEEQIQTAARRAQEMPAGGPGILPDRVGYRERLLRRFVAKAVSDPSTKRMMREAVAKDDLRRAENMEQSKEAARRNARESEGKQ